MARSESKSLFRRLTRLFRSGPIVKRKIRALDTTIAVPDKTKSSGTLLFQKSLSPTYATITSNAYNLSERLMRYQDFQEMEYTPEIAAALDIYADETCAQDEKGRVLHIYSDNEKIRELLEDLFYNVLNVEFNLRSWARNLPVHKDTVIPLLDGRNITIEQLAREYDAGKENWVYSVQDGSRRIVPGKVVWCGLTRKNSKLVRVWLDDGTYVDCTPDHRFKLRDGSSKEAQHLMQHESLMPFYRKISSRVYGAAMDGYEEVYDVASGRYVYTHRRVAEVLEEGTLKNGRYQEHKHFPLIAATTWFQRAEKKSAKMSGVVPQVQETLSSVEPIYMNHKVDRVEWLETTSDVYCMEVLGPEGEHDRHNFAVLSTKQDGTVDVQSGIFLENCKYGDFFLYNDVSPEYGVVNAFPIPVNEIEREENYDRDDPFAVRYRWVTLGNRTLENWEVTHFRLLGNDMFLPYGSSIIEPARRIWRQLILIEDAMLVYRVVRAPERRVFYIDVANVPPQEVPQYIEQQRSNLRTTPVADRATGRVDMRYNPMSVEEDFFIPVRGGDSGTKIDTLAGGQNTAAVEDVAYIQKKLFAALKIPRAYLGYDELLSSKATLAQEDIRFSRTVNVIQKTMIAELNKLAIIHLYAHGFDNEDLQNFTLRLSNPSTVAQQQKLELWRTKFEIAGSVPEGMVSKKFIRHEIWGLNDEQIAQLDDERLKERFVDSTIEMATAQGSGEGGEGVGGAGGEDLFGGGEGEEAGGELSPGKENSSENPEEEEEFGKQLITGGDDQGDEEVFALKLKDINDKPVKVASYLDKVLYNRGRRRTHGASKIHIPDFRKMTSIDNRAMEDPYDNDFLKSMVSNPFGEGAVPQASNIRLSQDVISILKKLSLRPDWKKASNVLQEGKDVQDEIDSGNNEMIDLDLVDSGLASGEQLNARALFSNDEEGEVDK
jgi:hypothetical protein